MSYEQDEALIRAGDASIAQGRFKDTGCSLHPACLTCPRPTCIHDDMEGTTTAAVQAARGKQRRDEALALRAQGYNGTQIAARMHLNPRTVYGYFTEALRDAMRSSIEGD